VYGLGRRLEVNLSAEMSVHAKITRCNNMHSMRRRLEDVTVDVNMTLGVENRERHRVDREQSKRRRTES
jgi:hypothetical protein